MSKRRHPRSRLSKQRLFLAIRLPHFWRRELRRLAKRLQRRYQLQNLRWLPPASFHLTLLFLGWVPTRDLGKVENKIYELTKTTAPFWLESGGLGVFPDINAPHTLWLGVGRGSPELTALHQSLCQQFRFLHLRPSEFQPHFTLARFDQSPDKPRLAALLEEKQLPNLQLKVDRIALMESFLHPEGAVYRQRQRFNFSVILGQNGQPFRKP